MSMTSRMLFPTLIVGSGSKVGIYFRLAGHSFRTEGMDYPRMYKEVLKDGFV